jgi:hypothetical protein
MSASHYPLAVLVGLWLSPAAAQTDAPNNMLTAAGFVVKYPDTPEKREIFNSLPPNRLVKRRRNGKIYYVYADPGGCGCAYVGSPNAYANDRNGGFRDRDNNDRVVSEMMRDMDQDDSPEQPGSPNGLDYIFRGADFRSNFQPVFPYPLRWALPNRHRGRMLAARTSTAGRTAMADAPVVAVSRMLDERGLSSFHIKLLVWSFFIVLIDGYDIGAIAFAAPSLVRAWGIDRESLGPVFSASLVGILVGSGVFGWVGDRYGRKAALIGSLLLFGIFTWIAAYSSSITQMFWLRLIAGIGIGGVIPNVIAINVESAPRRLRATLGLIAVGFVPIGGAIPGFVSAALVPQYGWQLLFLIGGILPIVIAVAAIIGLPESIKYMTIHESQRGKMERLIAEIQPDFKVPANAKFVIEDERQFPGFNPGYLLDDGLEIITPLTGCCLR